MTREELIALLRQNGIDTNAFGTGEAKSIDDLLEEVEKGETMLSQQVVREVSVMTIDVFANVCGKNYYLVEVEQVFDDGRRRKRELPTSLSEKMLPQETFFEAIFRGLNEELGIEEYYSLNDVTSVTEVSNSPSFPGILTIYRLHKVNVLLDPSEYKPEGYEEKDNDLTSYFRWVPIEE